MRLISIYCLTLAMTTFVALPPAAQIQPSPRSASSSSRTCSFGIAKADQLIEDMADQGRTGAAMLQLEIARNLMDDEDYRGCVTYIDNAMRVLKATASTR